MIWIIASIPFWALAAFTFCIATAGLVRSLNHEGSQRDFNQLISGTIMIAIFSGILAILAAKICS